MTVKLNALKPKPGSSRGKIRIGRGIGSGKGKTGGRGGKGQTARSGSAVNGFEGGQTPIHRRLPKRGFSNFSRVEFEVVNVSDIQKAIDDKKLKAGSITVQNLLEAGLIKGRLDGVKLLGDGKITAKIEISVQKASASALKSVEKAGGSVVILKLDSAAKTAKNDSKSLRGKKSPENVKKKAEKPAKVAKAPKAAKEKKSKK
jgi:large subunit ribosomal protein L15